MISLPLHKVEVRSQLPIMIKIVAQPTDVQQSTRSTNEKAPISPWTKICQ